MQFRRGLFTSLPGTPESGEPLWTTDSNRFFIGTGTSSVEFASLTSVTTAIAAAISALVFPSSAGPTTHEFVSAYNSATGVFTLSQPTYSDISGTPQLPITIASASHEWLKSYNSTTGLFTQTQPDYSDLTGTP